MGILFPQFRHLPFKTIQESTGTRSLAFKTVMHSGQDDLDVSPFQSNQDMPTDSRWIRAVAKLPKQSPTVRYRKAAKISGKAYAASGIPISVISRRAGRTSDRKPVRAKIRHPNRSRLRNRRLTPVHNTGLLVRARPSDLR